MCVQDVGVVEVGRSSSLVATLCRGQGGAAQVVTKSMVCAGCGCSLTRTGRMPGIQQHGRILEGLGAEQVGKYAEVR
jgi:hypothetical protein